jgi:putative transposase
MLVSQAPNCGNYADKLPAKARALLEEVVNETYLTDRRLTVVAVHKHVEAGFAEHNAALPKSVRLPVPSLNAVYAQVRRIDAFTRDYCRLGKRVAEHRHRLLKSGPVTGAHHERWEIDHTTVNCLAVDGKTGAVIGRPTITAIIDRHTRMIMGFHISFDGPCTSATMECLRMAILPKGSLLARHPSIKGVWPWFGKPLIIVPDNEADFRSTSFVEACLRPGTDVDYPPVLKAWYKGTIERFFRTLAVDVFHRMPGTTFSNFYERNGEATPEMAAVVTLAELEFYVLQYVVDVYHARKHRGLDRPPIEAWKASVAANGLLPPPDPDQPGGRSHRVRLPHDPARGHRLRGAELPERGAGQPQGPAEPPEAHQDQDRPARHDADLVHRPVRQPAQGSIHRSRQAKGRRGCHVGEVPPRPCDPAEQPRELRG